MTSARKARIEDTTRDVKKLQAAAVAWRVTHGNRCPTVNQVRDDGGLDTNSSIEDAWGSLYVIECTSNTTTALSYGPDRKAGTSDDIRCTASP